MRITSRCPPAGQRITDETLMMTSPILTPCPDDLPPLERRACAWARANLSDARFAHTVAVVAAVTRLAPLHGLDGHIPALRMAGWIHDAAKERDGHNLLAEAKRLGCSIRPVERRNPDLLHGAVALRLAEEALDFHDPVTASAVLYHTTGHPAMSRADRLFYLADLVEPSRTANWIGQLRVLVERDLDEAMLFALVHQLRRLLRHGIVIDPRAVALYNRLLVEGVPLPPPDGAE